MPLLIVIKHKPALCGRKAFQMVVHITELGVDHGQPLEEVADIQLFCHAHATMQLHRFLTDEPTGFANLHFCTGGALARAAASSSSFIFTI